MSSGALIVAIVFQGPKPTECSSTLVIPEQREGSPDFRGMRFLAFGSE